MRFPLIEPGAHFQIAVHRRRCGEILASMLCLADAAVELAQAEVALGDERAHAVQLGECQRLSVVGRRAVGIEPVGVARDVAEQAQGMGRGAGLTPSGFDRAIGQRRRASSSRPSSRQARPTAP